MASFEVGPHSANKLKELSSNPVNTLESLKAFNKEYFVKWVGFSNKYNQWIPASSLSTLYK